MRPLIATVMAQATDFSIIQAVKAGAQAKVMADLYCWPKNTYVERALRLEELGVDYLLVHLSIDEFRDPAGSKNPLDGLKEVAAQTKIPVGAVVFATEEAHRALDLGAQILVIGTPIIESKNALAQMTEFIQSVKKSLKNI